MAKCQTSINQTKGGLTATKNEPNNEKTNKYGMKQNKKGLVLQKQI